MQLRRLKLNFFINKIVIAATAKMMYTRHTIVLCGGWAYTMAIWYEVEKSKAGIKNFLDSNWSFHDFRIEKIEYISRKNMVEIFLKYDTETEGALLRFSGVQGVHINLPSDYNADFIMGCCVLYLENDTLLWLDDESCDANDAEQLSLAKQCATWVESKKILWAITDGDGNPIEMPPERIDQVWVAWGKTEERHFDLKPFDGNWDVV